MGTRLDDPLVVQVTDSDSRPIAGVAIVFRFQSDVPGAEVDQADAATNAEGKASARVRLGETTGSQPVEARVAQASAPNLRATFDLTALAERGGGGHDDDD